MERNKPRVSIGLPVYNGENYLAQAIESVLTQTYSDFELVLSDNGSTDYTPQICQKYANQDARVLYARSEKNMGAAWNFNRVFELSSGVYFKWMSHDDLIAPTFIEKCAAALDENPGAVIAYPRTIRIGAQGETLEQYGYIATSSPAAHRRFHDLLFGSDLCFEIFGLIRSDTLRRTRLMGNYGHADGVLLNHLALLGTFQLVPERLFYSREHPEQSVKQAYEGDPHGRPNYHTYTHWFDPTTRGKLIFPNWRILAEYFYAVSHSPITARDALRCYYDLLIWIKRHNRYLRRDLAVAFYQIRYSRRSPSLKVHSSKASRN